MTTLKSMSIIQCAKEISIKHEKTLLMMLLRPTPHSYTFLTGRPRYSLTKQSGGNRTISSNIMI